MTTASAAASTTAATIQPDAKTVKGSVANRYTDIPYGQLRTTLLQLCCNETETLQQLYSDLRLQCLVQEHFPKECFPLPCGHALQVIQTTRHEAIGNCGGKDFQLGFVLVLASVTTGQILHDSAVHVHMQGTCCGSNTIQFHFLTDEESNTLQLGTRNDFHFVLDEICPGDPTVGFILYTFSPDENGKRNAIYDIDAFCALRTKLRIPKTVSNASLRNAVFLYIFRSLSLTHWVVFF